MEITKIYSLVKRYAGVTDTQYPNTDFIDDINIVKDEFWTLKVAQKLGKINYDIWTTDSVALQSEYKIPTVSSTLSGTKTIQSLGLNYDGKTYETTGELIYTPATEVNPHTLKYDWGYYKEHQSADNPLFYYSDKSLFIAPVPKTGEDGVNRIKIEGVRKIADYTMLSTEAELKFDADDHRVLMWGCIPFALMGKRANGNEIAKAQADYIRERDTALRAANDVIEGPSEMKFPNFTNNTYELGIENL